MEMNTGERVAEAIWAGFGMMTLVCVGFWLFMPPRPGEPSRYALFVRWFRYRYFTITSSAEDEDEYEEEPQPAENAGSNRTNDPSNPAEPALESRTQTGTSSFVLNADELPAIARMIEHKTTAEKPTKASCIWAGFGVKKGDSTKYKRANLIYDSLFVLSSEPAVKYATITPEQQALRNDLEAA